MVRRLLVVCFSVMAGLSVLAFSPAVAFASDLDGDGGEVSGAQVSLDDWRPFIDVSGGIGTAYGGAGGAIDFQFIPYVSFFGGYGATESLGLGVGGMRFHIPIAEGFSLRITGLGGQVGVITEEHASGHDETLARSGWGVGIGSETVLNEALVLSTGVYYVNGGSYRDDGEDKVFDGVTYLVGIGGRINLPKP